MCLEVKIIWLQADDTNWDPLEQAGGRLHEYFHLFTIQTDAVAVVFLLFTLSHTTFVEMFLNLDADF